MTITSDFETYTYLFIMNIVTVSLSVLGSLFMIAYCLRVKNKTVALKFTLCLSISDFIYSISNFMSIFYQYQNNSAYCQIEGFIRQSGLMFSIFSATSTSILCFKDSKYGKAFDQNKFFRKVVPTGAIICLIFALSPFIVKHIAYGQDTLNCWVLYRNQSDMVMGSVVYAVYLGVPIGLGVSVSLLGYIIAIKNYKEIAESILGSNHVYVYKLFWYPAVMFIIFVPCLVNKIIQTYLTRSVTTEAINIIFMHSMGFANALVYGSQRSKMARVVERDSLEVANRQDLLSSGLTNSLTRGLVGANGSEV